MNLLETLTDQYISCTTDTKLIRFYHTQLIRRLTKLDRRMVLRIIDEKDLLIEKAAMENHQRGFAMGMVLAAKTICEYNRFGFQFAAPPRAQTPQPACRGLKKWDFNSQYPSDTDIQRMERACHSGISTHNTQRY